MIFSDTINYKGVSFPYRFIRIKEEREYHSYIVSVTSLEDALLDNNYVPKDSTARFIDEKIFFYVADKDINLHNDKLVTLITNNL